MVIVLKDHTMINIIVSSVEVFKKETYGILLGNKRGKNYNIHNAVTFQTAERDYFDVSVNTLREKRINTTLQFLGHHKLMGDFHSHTNNYENLSKNDIKELKKLGDDWISILVSVKKTKRTYKWKYNRKQKALAGSIAKNFFVKIIAFKLDHKREKVVRIPIKCDYIKTLNKRQDICKELSVC